MPERLRSATLVFFLKDIVVNALTNQTTVIALRPDSFRARTSGRVAKYECQMERNLTFAAEDLDEAGIAPWLVGEDGYDCRSMETLSPDASLDSCIAITVCKGAHCAAVFDAWVLSCLTNHNALRLSV